MCGPYTLKGKDSSSIDFMYLTMIDPATSCWFKIVELPTVAQETTVPHVLKVKRTFDKNTKVAEPFDKSSAQVSNLV
jgi:hypothetical protein